MTNPVELPLHTAGGFSAAERRYRAGTELPLHQHEGATLSLVFRGTYREQISRRNYFCEPLSFLYKPRQITHANFIGEAGLRGCFIELAPNRFEQIVDGVGPLNDVRCARTPAARSLVARAGREVMERSTAFGIVLEGIVLELLGEVARQAMPPEQSRLPVWLLRARDYLHAHFREPLGLTEVAEVAGVHPIHLAKMFRRRIGCSVGTYVRNLRIDYAARALTSSPRSAGQIAIEAGFADHSHFTRAFKARFGITPTQYRAASAS